MRQKQKFLPQKNKNQMKLSGPEAALLAEETYELSDKGEPVTKPNYLQLPKNIKFTFRIMTRAYGVKYDLKLDDLGWDSFLKAVKIRNRIVHPKQIQDLSISNEEIEIAGVALMWFTESAVGLTTLTSRAADQKKE